MNRQILRIVWTICGTALLALASACKPLQPQPPTAPSVQVTPTRPAQVDRVVVLKSLHLLELMHDGKIVESFPVSLGPHAQGPKHEAGDGRTPEGTYRIDGRTERTKYTRALHISYPNAEDRAQAAKMNVEPGGGIYIHGVPRDYGPYDPPERFHDWTDGCISVGNAAIVKIWDAVPDGTSIDILP